MKLKHSFFNRETNIVARELLGKKIVRVFNNGTKFEAILTETEAYHGFKDKASHASRKKTERNKVMFEGAGVIYVYLVYGMHYCLNFVTMGKNFPAAVLVRSIAFFENGKWKEIRGPGRVCKFLKIDKKFYGEDLEKSKRIWLEDGIKINRSNIINSKRIGIEYAEECKDWEWNYKIEIG